MVKFILLEPSCDIHLALGEDFNELPLQVFKGDWEGTPPALKIDKIPMAVGTNNLEYDFSPVGQSFVEMQSGKLVAKEAGLVLMQVRLKDPIPPDQPDRYHYIVARIQVHKKIKGWWFGNKSLSVFKDPSQAHSQPSLYALFEDKGGKNVVGDITGHGYVNLASKAPTIFDLSTKYRDRIQGKNLGEGMLEGSLFGEPPTSIPVKVVDFMAPLAPKLVRVDGYVDLVKPRAEKFNILFLAEGFRKDDEQDDEPLFVKAVQKVCQRLVEAPRHSPFKLLRDDFNFWRAFAPSRERGITISSHIGADGSLWNQNFLIHDPHGILQARDSFYGLRYGYRPGERFSIEEVSEVITELHPKFFTRAKSWYYSIADVHKFFLDWRRYSPELLHDVDEQSGKPKREMLHNLILKHIERRIDPGYDTNDTNHEVGKLWHPNWIPQDPPPDPNADGRQVSSVGLVCILVNDGLGGGNVLSRNDETLVAVSIDTKMKKITPTEEANDDTKILNRTSNATLRVSRVTAVVAHEFGHSFCNLGDEYETTEQRNPEREHVQGNRDNLMYVEALKSNEQKPPSEDRPVVSIDPDKLKWNLHRIRQADTIIRKMESLPGDRIKVTLAKGKTKRWEKIKNSAPPNPVFVRKFKAISSRQQLPIEQEDLLELQIVDIPNDGSNTIILGGGSLPSSIDEFGTGSVLYIPRRHVHDNSPKFLIEWAVLVHLQNTNRPLSFNFRWHQPSIGSLYESCDVPHTGPDRPPRIPGFNPPCEGYHVIGVYEGGGTFSCGVYRPAGACKMRSEFGFTEAKTNFRNEGVFCYVCKYLIVNKVNPSKLSELEKEYPIGV